MPITTEASGVGSTASSRNWGPVDIAIAGFAMIAVVVSAFWVGWSVRDRAVLRFSEVPPEDVDVLLGELERVGVTCAGELDVGHSADDSPMVRCRTEPTFSLVVDPSVAESYQALDLALSVGCLRVDAPPPDQWYLARRGTWSLLTFDRDQATAAGRLEGVTITVGTCARPLGRAY